MNEIMKNTQEVSELYGHPEFYGVIDILREHNHPAIVTYVVALKIGGAIIDCHAYEEEEANELVDTIVRYNRFCERIAEDFYDRFRTFVDYAVIGITSTGEKYRLLNDGDVRFFQKHFSDECGITERLCKAFKVNEETVKTLPNEEVEYSAEDFCIWGSGEFCVSASFWDVDGNARCYPWEYHWGDIEDAVWRLNTLTSAMEMCSIDGCISLTEITEDDSQQWLVTVEDGEATIFKEF